MPFDVPEALLQLLSVHRERRRSLRAQRNNSDGAEEHSNFIDSIRRLFSGGGPVDAVAKGYVGAMNSWEDEMEREHDAFLLDPGMGPMLYLTADGRILEDMRGWDGDAVNELTEEKAYAALVIGAKKTGIAELLDLIPAAPVGAETCARCKGKRTAEPVEGFGHELPCDACGCRGWTKRPPS